MKENIKKIIVSLPDNFYSTVRDISLLSCSIFGEAQADTVKKLFKVDLSFTFWLAKENQIVFYRLEKEYENFSRILGEHFFKDKNYAAKLANKLREITDWFNDFLEKNKKIESFISNSKRFFDEYRKFFAYHQAVYYGGDYLTKINKNKLQSQKTKKIIEILNSAYKYNELVIPNVEKYFKRLGVSDFLPEEIKKNNFPKSQKNRSLLFLKNRRYILSENLALQIDRAIKKKQKNIKTGTDFKKGIISGSVAYPGFLKGRARVIKKLEQLKNIGKEDILVAPMTRPQFNEKIKNVKAIITDEGGLLCHAAIISRELGIPCIVGTKIATQVLKDGQLVEVDANKGIVRVLSCH